MPELWQLSFLACVYPSFPVYADKVSELEQKLKEEKEKKKDTENRIGESQNELDSLRNTTNGLKGELSDLNDNLEEVSANLDDLEGKIAAKNEEIEKTQAELEEAKQIEADQYAAMKKRIQFMYERQDYVLMETLFSSANYAELLNRSAYIESLAPMTGSSLRHLSRPESSRRNRSKTSERNEGSGGSESRGRSGAEPGIRSCQQCTWQDFRISE